MTVQPGGGAGWALRSGADLADLAAFCTRVRLLDPDGLIRLRQSGERLTAYSLLPLGVLVSRTVRPAEQRDGDRTVTAADLLATLESGPPAGPDPGHALGRSAAGSGTGDRAGPGADGDAVGLGLPRSRDGDWRGTLPPASGWRRLDSVPVAAIAATVRAGLAAFESVRGRVDAAAVGESLLDHEALTVSSGDDHVVLPLRVLHAAWRMGFLGADPRPEDGDCAVSAAGRWIRLAAPHGSAYHQASIGLAIR
jgi:hypothetical protein